MHISAQVSLYPLRQERLSPAIEEAWKILEEHELDVEKGSMSTIVSGEGVHGHQGSFSAFGR